MKSHAWEQRNFDEVFVSLPNNTLSRSDLNDSDGTSQDVHYGDVLIKFNEILDLRETELPFISASHSKNINALGFLKDGDVVIADTAEDSTVGKSVELHNVGSKVVESGLHTMPYRPQIPFAPKFLGFFLNSSSFHQQLLPLMQGTKVVSISKSSIKDRRVYFPSERKEQESIADFFSHLNSLLTLHQRQSENAESRSAFGDRQGHSGALCRGRSDRRFAWRRSSRLERCD